MSVPTAQEVAEREVRISANRMLAELTEEQIEFLDKLIPEFDKLSMDRLMIAHDLIARTVRKNRAAKMERYDD